MSNNTGPALKPVGAQRISRSLGPQCNWGWAPPSLNLVTALGFSSTVVRVSNLLPTATNQRSSMLSESYWHTTEAILSRNYGAALGITRIYTTSTSTR
jgi:hypothetical protein